MYTLFIDTHDKDILLGLFKDDELIDSYLKESTKSHSDFIMPMLDELLKKNNLTVHELNEILVVNGPGSFTGVRLGVIIGKTLAYTLNIPIKTITSLEVLAVSNESDDRKLPIIHDLKGVFGALFSKDNELIEDYFYKSNDEFDEYVKNKMLENNIIESNIDLSKVFVYSKSIEPTVSHAVNPIYIKVIEALKDDKKN